MKKKILITALMGSVLFGGIVGAAGSSIWGTYKGNEIVRLTVDGVPVKVSDVPAINYEGRTMIPIYLLQQAGIEYEWDQKNKTVNVKNSKSVAVSGGQSSYTKDLPSTSQDSSVRKPLTAKEIAKLVDRVGYVETYNDRNQILSSGSGFMLENGWFISNHHVLKGSSTMLTKLDGIIYNTHGWYWYSDEATDVFITALSTSYSSTGDPTGSMPSKYLNFTTDLPEVGDKVYAIGSPIGLENTVTEGIVSGIRNIGGITKIQHTADITNGSSGGVLLNEYGDAIGITSGGVPGTNIEYAIPMQYVEKGFNVITSRSK